MKIKWSMIIGVIGTIVLGYFCAEVVFKQYQKENTVFQENHNIYFLQQGVYTKEESIPKSTKAGSPWITVKQDGKYYVYVGMTTSQKNAQKIQKIYKEQGMELYLKEDYLSNEDFMNELQQYDVLLKASKNQQEVDSVLKTVLSSYEEIVLKR